MMSDSEGKRQARYKDSTQAFSVAEKAKTHASVGKRTRNSSESSGSDDFEADSKCVQKKTNKSKRAEDSEDSEGESEQQKAKSETNEKRPRTQEDGSLNLERNSSGEEFMAIGSKRRVTIRKFRGVVYIDVREHYVADGEVKPGKKGISLTAEQWNLLIQNADKVSDAVSRLK